MKKKQLFAICMLAALLLTCWIPVHAEEDYDALAIAAGYHARVGEASAAYDEGKFTDYIKFNDDFSGAGGRDNALKAVPAGATVTMIQDVVLDKELYFNGNYTLDGADHTIKGGIRSDSGSADVTVKNLTIETVCSSTLAYVGQINPGNRCAFEDCTFKVSGVPAFALFVARGEISMSRCTLAWNSADADVAGKDIFRVDNGAAVLRLEDTEIGITPATATAAVVTFYAPAKLVMKGKTKLNAVEGKAVVINGQKPSITMDSTVSAPITPADYAGVSVTDIWDGSVDTSWFDKENIKESYELNTAAKLAGLAKLVKDSGTANFPQSAAGKTVTFYITANIDLDGRDWLPIGNTYATRFGGKLIGKVGTAGEPAVIKGLKVTATNANAGFVGSIDEGAEISKLTFESPRVSSVQFNSVAVVCGYARSGATFTDITVKDALITANKAEYIGGICAYSKYGADSYTNCVFDGDIVLTGACKKVGGISGSAVKGAAMTNCYVSGSIVASDTADQIGGFVGALDAGATLTMTDCQMDSFIKNGNASANETGALIGSIAAGANAAGITMTRVFVSGLSVGSGAGSKVCYAWIGMLNGNATLTAEACVSLAKLALCGEKAENAVLTGGESGITVSTLSEADAALKEKTDWRARTGMYPVLAVAAAFAPTIGANADYSWFDFAADAAEIADFNQLVGFSILSKMYDFGGKTVRLTQDIDGSGKLAGQTLSAGGTLNEHISAVFRGSFNKNGHSIQNVDFELGESGKYIVTWVVGDNITSEEYDFGETPVFKGETTREDDRVYRYEFKNWDQELVPVSADVTYTARWKKTRLEDLTKPVDTDPPEPTGTQPGGSDTAEPAKPEGGCKSALGFGILPLILIPAVLVVPFVIRNDEKKRSIR